MSQCWMRLDVRCMFERAEETLRGAGRLDAKPTLARPIAGFLASYLMGRKNDLLTNLLIGVVGAVVGGLLGGFIGITASNIVGQIIIATAGAALCIWLWQRMR